MRYVLVFLLTISAFAPTLHAQPPATAGEDTSAAAAVSPAADAAAAEGEESDLLSGVRQLTFDGRRAGEGYFSSDGSRMVFQSERDPSNPFYQIFVMDMETGDLQRVSPGWGKTTCGWIHPAGDRVLFASTHEDPQARDKQTEELELRRSGRERRYAWDYDPAYDLLVWHEATGDYTRLTEAEGYDAEGSYSPDGTQVVFASNRDAFTRPLSDREQTLFETDPASMIDLYIMNADGSNVRRLTSTMGYDGGPFFSPDGTRICWRRFAENGATAEIFTMRTDGSDVQRLTSLDAMSWAPFYHPSGDYLVFTTNRHGFANFELYLVRSDGQGEPVRVTYTDGFDGLPVFTPDGQQLSWTSNRTEAKQSQIFLANWNDELARQRLDLPVGETTAEPDRQAAFESAAATEAGFSPADIGRHVDYLTRPELGGRLTGTDGERRATAYVAAYLENLGFEPAGMNGTFFHPFEFPAGAVLGEQSRLAANGQPLALNEQWRPLSFSGSGEFDSRGVVFAGYGMEVPESEGFEGYDSYVHLDVTDQWVLIFRDLPQEIPSELRQRMARYSSARRKAMVARDHGAHGVILVAGPTSQVKNELIGFESDASAGGTSIPVLSVTNEVAAEWLAAADMNIEELQRELDDGSMAMGAEIEGLALSATVAIERRSGTGRNVLARLPATSATSRQSILVGAHIDHLGTGTSSSSLAREDEREQIHAGADDNASGVAAMLEMAQYLAAQRRAGGLDMQRDLIVAAWSGEELGLFGSQAFAEDFQLLYPDAPRLTTPSQAADQDAASRHAEEAHQRTAPLPPAGEEEAAGQAANDADTASGPASDQASQTPSAAATRGGAPAGHGASTDATPLYPAIAAYLNLDMVGRLREELIVQGIGSSPEWAAIIQRRNVPVGLNLQLDRTSTRLPTDAAVFVARGVPSLSAFTGAHEDYHTPRDTADKLNYEGTAQISRLLSLVARELLTAAEPLRFELDEGEAAQSEVPRARLTAYLGTIPDYAGADVKGLKLSGVANDGPADQAGLQGGDVIVELAGRKIENIYDYTYAIEALKIGDPVQVTVLRGDERLTLELTPGSRE